MTDNPRHFRKLIESLRLLIAPTEVQATFFEPFADMPFEILDTYQNAFLLTPALIQKGTFSFSQIANLIRLNNLVAMLIAQSGEGDLSSHQGSGNQLHLTVHRLATDLLDSLGEPHSPIDREYL